MKRLLLLRHAKANRGPGLDDYDRPLAPRGIWAAEAMADRCAKTLRRVDFALCSSAIRARETLRIFERYIPPSSKIEQDDALYLADSRELVCAVRGIDDRFHTVLLVGHEPGLSEFAALLCQGAGGAKALRRIRNGLKTSSLATIDLVTERWGTLQPGEGRLDAVVRPKDVR